MEAPAKTVVLSVVAPAAAIVLGALSQAGLVSLWPQMQRLSIGGVSLDSYLVAATILLLSLAVGWWLRPRAPARLALCISVLVPTGWLIVWLAALLVRMPPVRLRFDALSGVYLGCATFPLLGIMLGWKIRKSAGARQAV